MSDKTQHRIARQAIQSRQHEIEQRILACGLARGPRRLFRGESAAGFEQAPSRRLRLALQDLGPIFSAFGLYMSGRADLWPLSDCLEFGAITDFATAAPLRPLKDLLIKEIGCPPEAAFSEFEVKPFESRLLFQSHHARLRNGVEVIVKVARSELQGNLLADVELLPLLNDAFAGCGLSQAAFAHAIADFAHVLQKQIDLVNEARALEALGRDAEEYDVLRAPQVQKQVSGSKVLVIEKLEGLRLSEIPPFNRGTGGNTDSMATGSCGFEPNELARLLCEAWLRQALLGRAFSVEPRPENILLLPRNQLAFTGGALAALPSGPQGNLWNYLVAAANDQPDKACACLLRELREEGTVSTDVVQRFRQAMPFRDGGWDASGDCHTLAELLFVQWRFASECGFTPLMHLPAFFRGLFTVAEVTRRIARGIDPLAEGIRDLRLLAGVSQFSRMFSQSHLAEQIDKYSALIMQMPPTIDEALTCASESGGRREPHAPSRDHSALGTSSAVVATLLLILAGVLLLSRFVGPMLTRGGWFERIGAIVFVTVCLMWLRNPRAHR